MAVLHLGDKSSLLTLHHSEPGAKSHVQIHSTMRSVLAAWAPTTRISPLFGVKEHSTENSIDFDFAGDTALVLLGPHHPLRVSSILECADKLWLTFGLFNCVVIPPDQDGLHRLIEKAKSESFRYEAWEIHNGLITNRFCSQAKELPSEWNKELLDLADKDVHPELEELVREYCPLMATALARSLGVVEVVAEDLLKANKIVISDFLNLPSSTEEDFIYRTQGQLTTINAGLSRLASQSFSGTIPVHATECHFWSHSLLGTGVANLALTNIASSIREKLGPMRIPKRIERLRDSDFTPLSKIPSPAAILQTEQQHDFWDGGLLSSVILRTEDTIAPIFPQFPFFSGRDGFRATLTTLSAPLATVTACNSMRWSLITISHEISHIIISAVLGKLLPLPNDHAQLKEAVEIIIHPPSNYFDSARKLLLLAMIGLHNTEVNPIAQKEKRPVTAGDLAIVIDSWHKEVEEIIVHVFDYSFFFDSIEDYVSSIWLSWGVIPNISNRIPEYILRTLCVALTNHFRRENSLDCARDDVRRILSTLHDTGKGGLYVEEALHLLDDCWEDKLKVHLDHRRRLVKFSRGFLCWGGAASSLRKEKWVTGGKGDRHGYPHKRREISENLLSNPLRFAKEFTDGVTPNASESLWLLLTAAFNYET